MSLAADILGWIGAFLLATFSIPQIFKTLKRKSVVGVNFTSIWIYKIRSLWWIVYASLAYATGLQVGIANLFTVMFANWLIFLLYKYKGSQKLLSLGISLFFILITSITVFSLFQFKVIDISGTLRKTLIWIVSLIASIITAIAFVPQVVQTFKKKNVKNLSIFLFLWGFSIGVIFGTYFLLKGIDGETLSVWLLPMLISFVGASIHFSEICLIIKYRARDKRLETKSKIITK